MRDVYRFQSLGVSRILFVILKWLEPKKYMFILNDGGLAASKKLFLDVSIFLNQLWVHSFPIEHILFLFFQSTILCTSVKIIVT